MSKLFALCGVVKSLCFCDGFSRAIQGQPWHPLRQSYVCQHTLHAHEEAPADQSGELLWHSKINRINRSRATSPASPTRCRTNQVKGSRRALAGSRISPRIRNKASKQNSFDHTEPADVRGLSAAFLLQLPRCLYVKGLKLGYARLDGQPARLRSSPAP